MNETHKNKKAIKHTNGNKQTNKQLNTTKVVTN